MTHAQASDRQANLPWHRDRRDRIRCVMLRMRWKPASVS